MVGVGPEVLKSVLMPCFNGANQQAVQFIICDCAEVLKLLFSLLYVTLS
jgi:hypothetical protein